MSETIPFKKGINPITRKDHEGRALPRFKELLRKEIRATLRAKSRISTPEIVEQIVQENIEYHRKHGFTPQEIEKFRRLYSAHWPSHKKS